VELLMIDRIADRQS